MLTLAIPMPIALVIGVSALTQWPRNLGLRIEWLVAVRIDMKKTKKVVIVPVTYVIYQGHGEVLVTTPDKEKEVIKLYFQKRYRAPLEEYDRTESREPCVCLNSSIQVD